MSSALAEEYLHWLEPQIKDEYGAPGTPVYWDLVNALHDKEFTWSVPNDDNRLVDGLELRAEFCFSQHVRVDALRSLGPCSFLEVLIGLSRRLSFHAGGQAPVWAWQLLNNLGLTDLADPLSRRHYRQVSDILDVVIRREYSPNGHGGLFPLIDTDEDQTQVELWYQMAEYIDEIHPEH